nr:hypothetical protein MACL_00001910 [Theileria orientalis]
MTSNKFDKSPSGGSKEAKLPVLRGKINLLFFLIFPIVLFKIFFKQKNLEKMPFLIFSFCAAFNFLSSIVLHLRIWEQEEYSVLRRIDYAGIFLMIGAGGIPTYSLLMTNDFMVILGVLHWILIFTGVFSSLLFNFCYTSKRVRRMDYAGVFMANLGSPFPGMMYFLKTDLDLIVLLTHLFVNFLGALAYLNTDLIYSKRFYRYYIFCTIFLHTKGNTFYRSVLRRIDYGAIFLINITNAFPAFVHFIEKDKHVIMLVFHLLINFYGMFACLLMNFIFTEKSLRIFLFWISHSICNFVPYKFYMYKMHMALFYYVFGYIMVATGVLVYYLEKPNFFKGMFEFHELSHLLYTLSSICIFMWNGIGMGLMDKKIEYLNQ